MVTLNLRLLFAIRIVWPSILLVFPESLIPDLRLFSRNLILSVSIAPPIWVDEWIQWFRPLCVCLRMYVQISLITHLYSLSPWILSLWVSIYELASLFTGSSMVLANFMKVRFATTSPVWWCFIFCNYLVWLSLCCISVPFRIRCKSSQLIVRRSCR